MIMGDHADNDGDADGKDANSNGNAMVTTWRASTSWPGRGSEEV